MKDPAKVGAVAWSLVELCPAGRAGRKRRALETQVKRAPYEGMELLARQMVGDPASAWVDEVLRVAEEVLATRDQPAAELVTFGLLEDLGNIASHGDGPTNADVPLPRLPPLCSAAWKRVDDLWSAAATQAGAASMTREKYDSVSSPELRAAIQRMFRRLDDGRYVGLADVIRHESARGGGPHVEKTG